MSRIDALTITIEKGNGHREILQFWANNDPSPLEGFCKTLICEGIVDEIHYTKSWSIKKETTKALEGNNDH